MLNWLESRILVCEMGWMKIKVLYGGVYGGGGGVENRWGSTHNTTPITEINLDVRLLPRQRRVVPSPSWWIYPQNIVLQRWVLVDDTSLERRLSRVFPEGSKINGDQVVNPEWNNSMDCEGEVDTRQVGEVLRDNRKVSWSPCSRKVVRRMAGLLLNDECSRNPEFALGGTPPSLFPHIINHLSRSKTNSLAA